jgi:cysteine synthase A
LLTTGKAGAHRVEGIGVGFEPPFLDRDRLYAIRAIDQELAFDMCRELAGRAGVFCGGSTGLNVVSAIELAKDLGPGQRVVTLGCDNGSKYLGGQIFG